MKACKELTIIIPTFNSKKYIAILLGEVCKYVKTVIVIDSYSTDDTLEIAREFKNVTVLENEYVNSATQKNYALQHVSTKWAMFIDSDELPEDGLMDEIVSVVDNNKVGVNLVRIPRKNFFWGRYLGRAGNYPDYQSRILRVGYGKFQDKEVHAQIEIKGGAVESLTKALLHDDFTDVESLLIRNTRYYKYELDELKKTNVKWGVMLEKIVI